MRDRCPAASHIRHAHASARWRRLAASHLKMLAGPYVARCSRSTGGAGVSPSAIVDTLILGSALRLYVGSDRVAPMTRYAVAHMQSRVARMARCAGWAAPGGV